jgi:multiple sugar transport system ATP-binding protein
MTLADRIAIMKGGLIQQLGPPMEIYNRPVNRYVAGFIGSPEMNFLEGQITGGVFTCQNARIPMDRYVWQSGAKDGPASLGIRPEHVEVGEHATGQPFQTETQVELVEPMGSDTLVWTRIADTDFRFRMDGQARVRRGDTIRLGFDPAFASAFNQTSGLRL